MKKLLILFLMCVGLMANAQRRRTSPVFDADTTRPAKGTYGITVIKDIPYLVPDKGTASRIETTPLFIKAKSYGTANKNVVLDNSVHHFFITGDSVNITLPTKASLASRTTPFQAYIQLLGYRGGNNINNKYTPFDDTFRYTFSDTIFHDTGSAIQFTKVFSHDATLAWAKVTEPRQIFLEFKQNRWYLFYADLKF